MRSWSVLVALLILPLFVPTGLADPLPIDPCGLSCIPDAGLYPYCIEQGDLAIGNDCPQGQPGCKLGYCVMVCYADVCVGPPLLLDPVWDLLLAAHDDLLGTLERLVTTQRP